MPRSNKEGGPGSVSWMHQVNSMLKNGFGVYDIALKLQCKAVSVQSHVKLLRENGALAHWFRR